MYPKLYYDNFLRHESNTDVFVAMPFTKEFSQVYEHFIKQAIGSITIGTPPKRLHPKIVNRSASGAADIHAHIIDAILHSRLIIADVSVQASFQADNGSVCWQPNANVLFEVGIATAWRNPEDILLIYQRHPEHKFTFDIQGLRHVEYSPTDNSTLEIITNEIVSSLNASGFLRSKAYLKVKEAISAMALEFMRKESERVFTFRYHTGVSSLPSTGDVATAELVRIGALKNRTFGTVPPHGNMFLVGEWTDLGYQLMLDFKIATRERIEEMRRLAASVPASKLPPKHLMKFSSDTDPEADAPAENIQELQPEGPHSEG